MKNDAIFAKNGQEKGVDDHDRTSLIRFCANEQIQKTTTTTKKKKETRCQCKQSTRKSWEEDAMHGIVGLRYYKTILGVGLFSTFKKD